MAQISVICVSSVFTFFCFLFNGLFCFKDISICHTNIVQIVNLMPSFISILFKSLFSLFLLLFLSISGIAQSTILSYSHFVLFNKTLQEIQYIFFTHIFLLFTVSLSYDYVVFFLCLFGIVLMLMCIFHLHFCFSCRFSCCSFFNFHFFFLCFVFASFLIFTLFFFIFSHIPTKILMF